MLLNQLIEQAFGADTRITARTEMEKGASSRRYFRLTLEGDGTALPPNVVQMVLPDDAMKSDEATAQDAYHELPFVNLQRHLNAAGLPVPQIYLDATDHGHLLLEDLGGCTLNFTLQNKSATEIESWYNAAIDLLSTMHDVMWPIPKACFASRRSFDYSLLRWELDHYVEWGLEKKYSTTLDPQTRENLDDIFDDFAREIDTLPKGFVHRDYQSRNLMVTEDTAAPSSLSIIDFQDALKGPRTYDLVALLNDSYVDLPFDTQQRLVKRYAQNRHLAVTDIQNEFDLITVQRKLKDGGRFVFIDQVKGDPSFLPFVSKSFSRVKAALARIDGHKPLKGILAKLDEKSFG
ncbi:MAG: phosphotransferase [Deltaproteobacteria bacterium]|nr:phosphotransferase [Deltaproteobacteria bacterium]